MSELFGTELKENEKDKKKLSIFKNFSVKAVETEPNETTPHTLYCDDFVFFSVESKFRERRNYYTPRIVTRILEDGIFLKSNFKKIPIFLGTGKCTIISKSGETPGQQYNLELFIKRTSNLLHIESLTSSKYPFKRIS